MSFGQDEVQHDPVSTEDELLLTDQTEPEEAEEAVRDDSLRSELSALLADRRYMWLSGILLLLAVSYTLKVRWGSGLDIWEHAAAARELGAHPLEPGHPLFALDRPHQFFSPYHLGVGLVSRVTGLSIVTVLSWAGIFNMALFLAGLWLFVTRLVKRRAVAFYAVLFVLFLWGVTVWYFSGFLHFKVLPLVLSYPSTFAKGLTLIGLWLHVKYLDRQDPKLLLPVVLIGAVTLLAHPVDAIFLFAGMAALTVVRPGERVWRDLVLSGGAVVLSFVLAFLWPYYPLFDLLFGAENEVYRRAIAGADKDMYVDVLGRIWPALLVVPFVVRRLWMNWRDPLCLFLVGLILAYAFGWRTEEWSYGRLISNVMLVGAIILADELTRAADAANSAGEHGRSALRWIQFTWVALLLVGAFNVRNGFIMLPDRVLEDVPYSWVHSDVDLAKLSQYSFLSRFVGGGDVVLSDLYTSLEVPTFGGKSVAVARAEAFVDTAQPGSDLNRFLEKSTSEADRRKIIDKYGARWILIRNERLANEPDVWRPMLDLGTQRYRNERFTLIEVGPPAGGP